MGKAVEEVQNQFNGFGAGSLLSSNHKMVDFMSPYCTLYILFTSSPLLMSAIVEMHGMSPNFG